MENRYNLFQRIFKVIYPFVYSFAIVYLYFVNTISAFVGKRLNNAIANAFFRNETKKNLLAAKAMIKALDIAYYRNFLLFFAIFVLGISKTCDIDDVKFEIAIFSFIVIVYFPLLLHLSGKYVLKFYEVAGFLIPGILFPIILLLSHPASRKVARAFDSIYTAFPTTYIIILFAAFAFRYPLGWWTAREAMRKYNREQDPKLKERYYYISKKFFRFHLGILTIPALYYGAAYIIGEYSNQFLELYVHVFDIFVDLEKKDYYTNYNYHLTVVLIMKYCFFIVGTRAAGGYTTFWKCFKKGEYLYYSDVFLDTWIKNWLFHSFVSSLIFITIAKVLFF